MAGKPHGTRGRYEPTPPPPYPGGPDPAGVYHWPQPEQLPPPIAPAPISQVVKQYRRGRMPPAPELVPPAQPPVAQFIELYRREQQRAELATMPADEARAAFLRRLLDAAEDRYWKNEIAIGDALLARELERHDPALVTLANLNARPKFIRQPLLYRLQLIREQGDPERTSTFLSEHIETVLSRLDAVIKRQLTIPYRQFAGRERLDDLLRLPQLGRRSVKTLATMLAAHMEDIFVRLHAAVGGESTPLELLQLYNKIGREALKVSVTPPFWDALSMERRKRGNFPIDKIPGALSRLICAAWWEGKLWHLRSIWREEQLRAVCLVNRIASEFVSHDALIERREQRRKNLDYISAHELVNDEGVTLSMEDVYYASASNPVIRRIEMMATVKGLSLVAEQRGDCAVYCTITTPSKYHATTSDGRPNPKWSGATVRESSDYLVDMFASVRKSLHRKGLRWYGVRVAEPHHDGTVHWHLVIFMRKRDRRRITAELRKFAIREDRAELGNNTKPRFDCGLIDPRKGSPVSYIAAYIGKNLDDGPLRGKKDASGKPMKSDEADRPIADTVENAVAWSSLHRVRQFQFFGIPSRQAYRELRLLATQLQRTLKPKRGAPLLANPELDAVLAAADVGCIATYITKQGGVMTPRDRHLVRTAYTLADQLNDYGEQGVRIFGVWSPKYGRDSRICTHADNWRLQRKKAQPADAGSGPGFDVDPSRGGSSAPWTRGNNCPPGEKTTTKNAEFEPITDEQIRNPALLTRPQRYALRRRLRAGMEKPRKPPQRVPPPAPDKADFVRDALGAMGITVDDGQIAAILRGAALRLDGDVVQLRRGVLDVRPERQYCRACCREINEQNPVISTGCAVCENCT